MVVYEVYRPNGWFYVNKVATPLYSLKELFPYRDGE